MSPQIEQIIEHLMNYMTSYGINVLGAIVTLIAGYIAAGWLSRLTDRAVRKAAKMIRYSTPCRKNRPYRRPRLYPNRGA